MAGDDDDKGTKKRGLPPIHRIKEPPMQHMSTRIRWYGALGDKGVEGASYTVSEISNYLGVRYQQVRNVLTTIPKRAAREDMPPLVVEVLDLADDIEAMEMQALVENMAAQRTQDRKARKAARRAGVLSGDDEDGDEEEDDDGG